MAENDDKKGPGRFRVETVRGEPYHVGGRTLVPVARVLSFTRARGTVGSRQIGGWMGAWVNVQPVAVLEQTPDGERPIPIVDTTASSLRGLLAAAAGVVVIATLIRWAVRKR